MQQQLLVATVAAVQYLYVLYSCTALQLYSTCTDSLLLLSAAGSRNSHHNRLACMTGLPARLSACGIDATLFLSHRLISTAGCSCAVLWSSSDSVHSFCEDPSCCEGLSQTSLDILRDSACLKVCSPASGRRRCHLPEGLVVSSRLGLRGHRKMGPDLARAVA